MPCPLISPSLPIQTLLSKRQACASEELTDMLQTHCFHSPMEDIVARLEKLSLFFLSAYNGKVVDYKVELRTLFQKKQTDPSLQRCQTTHKIYYYALENILKSEVNKIELRYKIRSRNAESGEMKLNNIDISALLKKDEFHRALYAICIEIVLVCSDSSKHFPWVLDVLELQAIHFYKVIGCHGICTCVCIGILCHCRSSRYSCAVSICRERWSSTSARCRSTSSTVMPGARTRFCGTAWLVAARRHQSTR